MSVINTNYLALVSQNNLTKAQNSLGTAIERLSSGLRINSAKDDAAGQAIANRFTSNIKGLTQASRNANDGISIAQTTEGSLNEINNNLQRIRELSVQAANGSNSDSDLDSIQAEINQRLDEIDRVSRESQFNGRTILGADAETLTIQVGANDGQTISINLRTVNRDSLKLDGFNVNGKGSTPNTAASADSLTLAKATQVGTTNEYQVKTDNTLASTASVLGFAKNGDTVAVGGTTYTYNATAKNYTHGGAVQDGEGVNAIAAAMTPELGAATKATVTIGGESTDITITSDGKITSTASGNTLYLDTTGNLTETKAGAISQATVETLSASLASSSGSSIAIEGGATYTTQAGYAGLSDSRVTTLADTATVAAQFTANASQMVELDVTLNGNTTTVKVDESNNVFAADGSTALYLSADGNLTADATGSQLTATSLTEAVAARSGTIEVTDGSQAATTIANGTTFGGNGRAVNASGLTISAAALADVVRQNNGVATVTLNPGDAAAEQTIAITSNGTTVSGIAFNGGGTDSIATGAVRVSADGKSLTDAATTDVSYWVQSNGNVTNDAGQRIYEDGKGGFTTDEATISERSPNPLDMLDKALADVDNLRSELGAVQNRFQSTIANLANTVNNLSAARSRIEDADYAVEVSNMTRAQILQQAGTSVLAQANQVPQSVLSLLR